MNSPQPINEIQESGEDKTVNFNSQQEVKKIINNVNLKKK